jgi:hypothetical protein
MILNRKNLKFEIDFDFILIAITHRLKITAFVTLLTNI